MNQQQPEYNLDIGDLVSIHPGNKSHVGARLALFALVKDYGVKIPFSEPIPDQKIIENDW